MFEYKKSHMNVPAYIWMDKADFYRDAALVAQIENLAKLPFVYDHVVLCPDGHQGYGMPIGGVIACDGYIVPNAVGVDIGCGVRAGQLNMHAELLSREDLAKIVDLIKAQIPVGFSHNNESCHIEEMPFMTHIDDRKYYPVISDEFDRATYQIGTLGGGNHFIEIQVSHDGWIWYMLHSGSRNLGKKVADYYNRVAKDFN